MRREERFDLENTPFRFRKPLRPIRLQKKKMSPSLLPSSSYLRNPGATDNLFILNNRSKVKILPSIL